MENRHSFSRQAARKLMARMLVVGALIGAIYGLGIGLVIYDKIEVFGILQGVFCGAAISTWCAYFDLGLLETRLGQPLKKLSFGRYIVVKTLYYMIGIDGGLLLGEWIFSPLYGGTPWTPLDPMFIATFFVALILSFSINFMFEVSRLLGPRVLSNFITGRYHLPREEERVFLFVDMIDSTKLAEQLGNVRFHELLASFFSDLTEAILATSGEVHAYVGDQVIVTWPLEDGIRDSRCLTCFMMMHETVSARREDYLQDFGVAPSFRAALHAGTVVTGEMGDQKRQIVFLGDTVNTTARLEQVARELDQEAVISHSLLTRMRLPHGLQAEALGRRHLRGKDLEVELHGLRLSPDATASEAA